MQEMFIDYSRFFKKKYLDKVKIRSLKITTCLGLPACPPEDCGSYAGYYQCLKALKDPHNYEDQELVNWLGVYNPKLFNIKETNECLQAWKKMMVETH